MEYRILGNTGIKVSRLCFGSLTLGPLQANLDLNKGADLIKAAFDMGVNFIDTAELYNTYGYIKKAVEKNRSRYIIAAKSYAYNKEGAEQSIHRAMKEMGTDYLDIFSLHEQESEHTIRGHYDAIEYLIKAKDKGIIRSIGISTHAVAAVKASLKYNEIEVLHPIVNKSGLGIIDGTLDDMLEAVSDAYVMGKGIYSMKALGGGNLIKDSRSCFDFVLKNDHIHSVAVGMQSIEEIHANVYFFEGKDIPESINKYIREKRRRLIVDSWCTGCGKCAEKCSHTALSITHGRAAVDVKKCVLCGYCSAYCPDFCLKII